MTKNDHKSLNHIQIHNLGHFLGKNIPWLNLVLVLLLKWSIVEGEVIVQLSCIYLTITIKFLEKFKNLLINFLNFQKKKVFEGNFNTIKIFLYFRGTKK